MGMVYLEKAQHRGFQAAHPITLPAAMLSRILRGVQISGEGTAIEAFLSRRENSSPVFSDEAVEFLAPLLSTALERAAPDQVVGFRVNHRAALVPEGSGAGVGSSDPALSPRSESTGGILYAYGTSLSFVLTEYRHRAEKPDAINMPNRRLSDPTGLRGRRVSFQPAGALKPDNYAPYRPDDDLPMLVIDYRLLEKSRVATAAPTPTEERQAISNPEPSARRPAQGSDDVQAIKDLLIKKDLELDALKDEVTTLKRQLTERDAQIEQLKRKGRRQ